MNRKQIALSMIVPCYLLGEVQLGEISINETVEKKTNSIEIDLETIEQHQSNSVFDLFKNEASIDIAGGGSSNAKRIYVRGVESSTLNITLDGATQGKNIFQHRGNEIGINPDILKIVDVRTAPDASKSGALGGAVEMITKDAQDFVKDGKNQGGVVKAGYDTNTHSNNGSLIAYGVYDTYYGILASISGVNNDNYKDGDNNEMYATAYQDRNYLLKFTIDNLNNHDLKVSFNRNSNSGDMQWGRNGSDKGPTAADADIEKIVSTTTNYTLQHNYSASNLLNLDTNINFTNVLVNREDEGAEYENDTASIKLQNNFYLDTGSSKNKISVGVQFEDQESTSDAAVTSTHSSNDLSHYAATSSNNKAVFIQNKTTFNNLDINYGVRFDKYEFETGLGEASDSTTSPNLGLDYKLNEKSKVYANYGEASRMTGTIPFTWTMNVVDYSTYSKDLKAEKSAKYELGYELKEEELFSDTDVFIFNANIFKTEIDDLIASYSGQKKSNGGISYAGEGGAPLTDIYNSDYKYTLKGFEIKGSYFKDNYFATLAYTQIDTNVYDEKDTGEAGEPLAIRRVGGWDSKKIVLNMGTELFDRFSIDYTLTAVAGIDNDDQITRAGYVTHDISTKYQTNKKSPWTYYLAVTNLTDKYYANHTTLEDTNGEYRRDMGRNYKFNIKYEF